MRCKYTKCPYCNPKTCQCEKNWNSNKEIIEQKISIFEKIKRILNNKRKF